LGVGGGSCSRQGAENSRTSVVAKGIDTRADSIPVEWRLLTNDRAETLAAAAEPIE